MDTLVYNDDGTLRGVLQQDADGDVFIPPGSRLWQPFLDRNAKSDQPLDLSDKVVQLKEARPIEDIKADVAKIDPGVRQAVTDEILARFLRDNPDFAQTVGVAVLQAAQATVKGGG